MAAVAPQRVAVSVIVRWVARILSIVCVALLLLFLVGEGDFSQPLRLSGGEIVQMLFFPLGIVVGMTAAWWRETLGAAITVGSLVLFYLLNILFGHRIPDGPWFFAFASPGFLFGLARWLAPRRRARS